MKKTVATFTASIYIGLKHRDTGKVFSVHIVRQTCRDYCNKVGLCVTVTPTEFIYTNGNEPGACVGLINYPRFPSTRKAICANALTLANLLKVACKQYVVSVVFLDKTVMLRGKPWPSSLKSAASNAASIPKSASAP